MDTRFAHALPRLGDSISHILAASAAREWQLLVTGIRLCIAHYRAMRLSHAMAGAEKWRVLLRFASNNMR